MITKERLRYTQQGTEAVKLLIFGFLTILGIILNILNEAFVPVMYHILTNKINNVKQTRVINNVMPAM